MRRTLVLAVAILISACSADSSTGTDPDDDPPAGSSNWSYSTGTDAISRVEWAYSSNYASGMTLFVRCRERKFEVYINTGFINDSGRVRYRIDAGGQIVGEWAESTDYEALFYRGGSVVAFADQLSRSSELVFAAREFGGAEKTVTFKLAGLSAHLPKIRALCGV